METWNFVSGYGCKFFSTTLVSSRSEIILFLRQYLYCNMSFRNPQIEGIPKNPISIESFPCCNIFPLRIRVSILSFRSLSEVFYLKKILFSKIGCLVSCVTIPTFRNLWENSLNFDTYCYSSWLFSNYSFEFINHRFKWKPYSWRGGSNWITIIINPCIKILIVRNFQKIVVKIDSSWLSKCFSVTTGLSSLMKFTLRNSTNWKKDSTQNSLNWIFCIHIRKLPRIIF